MPTYQITVKGKVQGVFYRATARDKARELGIKGWVRNGLQGDVEIMASGPKEKLEEFITWCRKGPSDAQVSQVSIKEASDIELDGFMIKR